MKNNLNKLTLLFFWVISSENLVAQVVGGDNVFEFINLSPSARISAMGGNLITVRDDDVNLAAANPSVLNPLMHNQLAFSHSFLPGGIGYGYVAYGHEAKPWGMTLHGGLQYIHYGKFDGTDETGALTSEFKASEYAFTAGAGRQLYERLSVGANLRFITSRMESYQSAGLAADFAAIFYDTAKMFNFTLVFRNAGFQLTPYTSGNRESVPFEVQAGVSKQLKYLPFRFSIVYRYLDRWNILYNDPNSQEDIFFFGEAPPASGGTDAFDNLARHLVFNGEFLFGKKDNFRLRFGYNHLMRKELSVRNLRSLAGFSMGAGLKISRFRIEYGRSILHLGANLNHFSISTNFREFTKK